MIETLDDIIEQIADWCGVYGAHVENRQPHGENCRPPHWCCRPCWTSWLRARIEEAVRVETLLNADDLGRDWDS